MRWARPRAPRWTLHAPRNARRSSRSALCHLGRYRVLPAGLNVDPAIMDIPKARRSGSAGQASLDFGAVVYERSLAELAAAMADGSLTSEAAVKAYLAGPRGGTFQGTFPRSSSSTSGTWNRPCHCSVRSSSCERKPRAVSTIPLTSPHWRNQGACKGRKGWMRC